MPRKLKDAVVVITGASSGIGRATAREFAEKKSTVVLAARRTAALHEVASECEQAGGTALVVPTDVTDESAVQRLAERAVEEFGRIDVWVNNAGVAAYGTFEETPPEVFRQTIETNLFGMVNGARAVLPIFRDQGRGVLINMGTTFTTMPQPYGTSYIMSKHAIRALGMGLRQELALEGAKHIHVSTVHPDAIDTPFFTHSANYLGRGIRPIPPVYSARDVAETVVRTARHPKREVFVGLAGRLLNLQMNAFPGLTERVGATVVDRVMFPKTSVPTTSGNLFQPVAEGTSAEGGWKSNGAGRLSQVMMVGAGIVSVAMLWKKREEKEAQRNVERASRARSLAARMLPG